MPSAMGSAYHNRMEVDVNERGRQALLTRMTYQRAAEIVLSLFTRSLQQEHDAAGWVQRLTEGLADGSLAASPNLEWAKETLPEKRALCASFEEMADAIAIIASNSREPMNFDNTTIIAHPFAGVRARESVMIGETLMAKLRSGIEPTPEDMKEIVFVSNVDSASTVEDVTRTR